MTLIEQMEAIATEIEIPIFYADLAEANYGMGGKSYPHIFAVPFNVEDEIGVSGLLQSDAPLQLFFLDKDPEQSTPEYITRDVEVIVQQMREKARLFFFKLLMSDVIDITKDKEKIIYAPTYDMNDDAVHGVMATTTIHFIEGLTGCDGQ